MVVAAVVALVMKMTTTTTITAFGMMDHNSTLVFMVILNVLTLHYWVNFH